MKTNNDDLTKCYSVDDAAKRFGVSPQTVRSYERQGVIKAIRFGNRVLIPQSEMNRVLKEGVSK